MSRLSLLKHPIVLAKLAKGHLWDFKSKPSTAEDIAKNQKVRYQQTRLIKEHETPDASSVRNIKLFWQAQTYVLQDFIKYLVKHEATLLAAKTPDDLGRAEYMLELELENLLQILQRGKEDQDRKNLLAALDEFLAQHSGSSETPVSQDSSSTQSSTTLLSRTPIASPVEFSFKVGDSIAYAREQALAGKKVLIMDAANNQRPGAGPYESGTFEEALTRNSDLYWQAMTSFRAIEPGIEVEEYKARYFKAILECIQYALKTPSKVGSLEFRKFFFSSGEEIYGDIQNRVLENIQENIPLKHCQIFNVKNQAILDPFARSQIKSAKVAIVKATAPDLRLIAGNYDRACTNTKAAKESRQPETRDRIIQQSISQTIDHAIKEDAQIILINAFGCGAFGNDPIAVARVFAQEFEKRAGALKGKQVVFMDLKPEMVEIFRTHMVVDPNYFMQFKQKLETPDNLLLARSQINEQQHQQNLKDIFAQKESKEEFKAYAQEAYELLLVLAERYQELSSKKGDKASQKKAICENYLAKLFSNSTEITKENITQVLTDLKNDRVFNSYRWFGKRDPQLRRDRFGVSGSKALDYVIAKHSPPAKP